MQKPPDFYLNPNGSVRTLNDDETKETYACHNGPKCSASWTYDDWHCTGCHWKGMGVQDLKTGSDALREKAVRLTALLKKNAD